MPYPQISPQLEVRNSYLADVHDAAHFIQELLDPVLKAPILGVYLPNQPEPVLRAEQTYWYESPKFLEGAGGNNNQQQWRYFTYEYFRVENFEQVSTSPWDIVNVNPNFDSTPKVVVLPHHLAATASLAPTMPVMGIKIAQLMIQNEIDSSRLYQQRPVKTVEEIILPFIRDELLPQGQWVNESQRLEFMQHDHWFQQKASQIYDSMLLIVSAIKSVLRDNGYQMCAVKYRDGYQIQIDQLGDYRIFEYERITEDPAYRRWLQAKHDGSWDRYLRDQQDTLTRY